MSRIPQRVIETRIGPPGGAALAFRELFQTVKVKKGNGGTPNKATITIHNLSQGTLAALERPGFVVQVLAGLDIPTPIFTGDIGRRSMKTKIAGGNTRITTIEATDGRRRYRDAKFSASYPAGTTRDAILPDILASLVLPVGPLPILPPNNFPAGWAFAGRSRSALSVLLDDDAIWSIQDGAIMIVLAGQLAPGNAVLISPATGMRGTPERTKKGLKVVNALIPNARIGLPVVVQSREVQGSYRAATVDHDIDNRSGPWDTAMEVIAL